MKPNFKVGDEVACINDLSSDGLKYGETYEVGHIEECGNAWFCDVKNTKTFQWSRGCYATRFEISQQPKNMKLKCINAKDSNSLTAGETYTKVDTNEHGNISVMTPDGRILTHYYKPDRFVEVEGKVSAIISLEKRYQTKNGCEVKLFAISDDGFYPVVGQYKISNHGWLNQTWTARGEIYAGNDKDELNLSEVQPDEYYFNGERTIKVNRKNKRVILTEYSYSFEDIIALAKEISQ